MNDLNIDENTDIFKDKWNYQKADFVAQETIRANKKTVKYLENAYHSASNT